MVNNASDLITLRGGFRTMAMHELEEHADDTIWHDGEESRFEYVYPLAKRPKAGWILAGPSWKEIAKVHIVDKDRAPYALINGVPEGELYELEEFWCAKSPSTHISCFLNAIDFFVPDGSKIFAAQTGTIIELIEHNDEWGDEQDENGEYTHRNHLNFMTIDVGAGEFMQYCHVAKGSVGELGFTVGSRVRAGQTIGKTAKNGVTDRDHLHFIVFRIDRRKENPFGFKSLIPRFRR